MERAPKFTSSNEESHGFQEKSEGSLIEGTQRLLESLKEKAANENNLSDPSAIKAEDIQDEIPEDEDLFGPFPAMQTGADPEEVRKAIARAKANDADHHFR